MSVTNTHVRSQTLTSELSLVQQNAVDLMVAGMRDREVAEQVGVRRETVTRWRLYHPTFKAELNRRRHEVWGSCADKMRDLLSKALQALEEVITDPGHGDRWKVALEVLKAAGFSGSEGGMFKPEGETEVRGLLKSEIKEKRKQEKIDKISPVSKEEIFKYMAEIQKKMSE